MKQGKIQCGDTTFEKVSDTNSPISSRINSMEDWVDEIDDTVFVLRELLAPYSIDSKGENDAMANKVTQLEDISPFEGRLRMLESRLQNVESNLQYMIDNFRG